jgi:hypothetical protein
MFHPIKAIKTEITETRDRVREFKSAYRYEKMIAASQAKLEETKLVPGYTNVYA